MWTFATVLRSSEPFEVVVTLWSLKAKSCTWIKRNYALRLQAWDVRQTLEATFLAGLRPTGCIRASVFSAPYGRVSTFFSNPPGVLYIVACCFKNCFQNTARLGRTGSASVTNSLDPRSHANNSLSWPSGISPVHRKGVPWMWVTESLVHKVTA